MSYFLIFFFFNDTATTEIYTLSLHDALPIFNALSQADQQGVILEREDTVSAHTARALGAKVVPAGSIVIAKIGAADRKSTRLNSSHANISYAVFCLKKKK